jgi:hypothetical protein
MEGMQGKSQAAVIQAAQSIAITSPIRIDSNIFAEKNILTIFNSIILAYRHRYEYIEECIYSYHPDFNRYVRDNSQYIFFGKNI